MTRRVRSPGFEPDNDPAAWRLALGEANVPDRYWSATVDAIGDLALRAWVRTIADQADAWLASGAGFYLHGPLNSGKSSIAAILAMEAIRRYETVLWLPVRDVLTARFREGARGQALDERFARADLLILDDLGSERFRLSTAGGSALEEAIRIPYDRRRSVVITSNISWRDFELTYAEIPSFISVVRRCVHPCAIINTQWPEAPARG